MVVLLITYFDLCKDSKFLLYASKRLANISEINSYWFPGEFPTLFRYRSLSSYAINDIINRQINVTSIGDFNDLFDGAIQMYGTETEQLSEAESNWEEICKYSFSLEKDSYISTFKEAFAKESRLKFNLLNFLGTYACCFSENPDSTLIWSHYADFNKGICIAYDFNQLDKSNLLRDILFPIAYSNTPIDVSDLMKDDQRSLCEYPLDTAVLCAALNKAVAWTYEKEWRLLMVISLSSRNSRYVVNRLPIRNFINPSAIYFGYHFLKPCFYYDAQNANERATCKENIKNITNLINYMESYQIEAFIMSPEIGSFMQKPSVIKTERMRMFMQKHFANSNGESVYFYNTINEHLLNCINGC